MEHGAIETKYTTKANIIRRMSVERISIFFKLKENNTNFKTEWMAGLTTFMTMAYILTVNPGMLSTTGMDKGALFTATALASIVGTLAMATCWFYCCLR